MNATAMAEARVAAEERLDRETAEAWADYLERTRSTDARYEEVEPWAWQLLRQRLKSIAARRRRL